MDVMRNPSSTTSDFLVCVEQAMTNARQANHRCVLVLAGEESWGMALAQKALFGCPVPASLWLGDGAPLDIPRLSLGKATQVLGQEYDLLIVNSYSGFDADGFGAVTGTLRGGGLVILITPVLDEWCHYPDPEHARIGVAENGKARFLGRLAAVLKSTIDAIVYEQEGVLPDRQTSGVFNAVSENIDAPFRTRDQMLAVAAIKKVVTGHRRRPLVLTADRGRGKSAALGIAAGQLLNNGLQRIIVTGPRMDAVAPVFDLASETSPHAIRGRGRLELGHACLEYFAPDDLLQTLPQADLILVDEAAAIPTPLLERMLRHYARIVFSTTVHGYEGTGQGFSLRFKRLLDVFTPDWKAQRLEQPIRWNDGDPLERLVFDMLLLDADAAPDVVAAQAQADLCSIEMIDRDVLNQDESMLSELFGLLVLAHYRTTPNDLRQLLDGENLFIHVMRYQGHIVAAAIVGEEGGFDGDTAVAIYQGKRRPRGHLIAQSLAVHAGMEQAATLRYGRILRIAVHPAAQGGGLGSRLVQYLINTAQLQGWDCLGASFGAAGDLLNFWGKAGYQPVRLGLGRDHRSGRHSVIVLKPLTKAGDELFASLRARFLDHLPHLFSDPLRGLEPSLAALLLQCDDPDESQDVNIPSLSSQDWMDIDSFAYGQRGYEVCLAPIWHLICAVLRLTGAAEQLGPVERDVLIAKVLQKHSWQDVAQLLGMTGKAQAIIALRGAVREVCNLVSR